MPRNGTGPAVSQTAIIGAPLATNAISVPAPSPISMLPAARACAILAAAAEIDDLQVEPVLLEDAELVADIDRNDRVRCRIGLADDEGRLGESGGRSRERARKRSNRRDGAQAAAPTRHEHEIPSPRA